MQRHGGDVKGFVAASKISRATLHRICTGGDVSDNNKRAICRELGYSPDIWEPVSDPTRPIRELEGEFFEWLDARGRHRASAEGQSPIRSLDFLAAPSSTLVGRKRELAAIDDQLNQHEQCIVEIYGPSGSGKTELVRGWWVSSGKKRITGHILAFSCRRIGTTDALLDRIRSLIGAETPESDLPSRVSAVISGAPHRSNAIVLDDLDFLMHSGWAQDESDRKPGLRFDRAAMREFVSWLALEVKPLALIVTTSSSLGHLFGAYPGYLSIDIGAGLNPQAGTDLVRRKLKERGKRGPISADLLADLCKKMHGQPQSLVLLSHLIAQTKPAGLPALLSLSPRTPRSSGQEAGENAVAPLLSKVKPASLNFIRVVALSEKGLSATILERLISDENSLPEDRRVFSQSLDGKPVGIDPTVDATLGLIGRTTDNDERDQEALFDMHLSIRTEVISEWQRTDPRSYERLHNWVARYLWAIAFPNVKVGFHPRALPTEGDRTLLALIYLVEAAYHLVRGAEAALRGGDTYRATPHRRADDDESKLMRDKVLSESDIEYIFSEHASPRARVQFAYRRIVIQRVDRFDRGKSSKYRFGLTRRFGRHEEKIRFLALLSPIPVIEGASDTSLLDLIDAGDQGQLMFDLGHNALQLGWLEIARRAFADARQRSQQAAQYLDASRGSILEASTHLVGGDLSRANALLDIANPFLRQAWTQATSLSSSERFERERELHAMDRRLLSFVARRALLTGEVVRAQELHRVMHESARLHGTGSDNYFAFMREHEGVWAPMVGKRPVAIPDVVLPGERGRLHMETELIHQPTRTDAILGYWWACFEAAADDGVEVEHTNLRILEAAIHRTRGDQAASATAISEAARLTEQFNVHFPLRLEMRLERARGLLWFLTDPGSDLGAEMNQITATIELAQDYGFKLLECDAWLVQAWLLRVSNAPSRELEESIRNAKRLIDQCGYRLRETDVEAILAGEKPSMIPLV